ncbi:MAG: M10 family metallopeptidase C-terminal domain-containing protein [Sedimentitalea sp.]
MAGERASTTITVDTNTNDDDQAIDAMLTGDMWDTSVSNLITYSFIDSASDVGYSIGATFANQLSAAQQAAVALALKEYSDVANLTFEEIGDDPGENNANGTLRYGDFTGLSTAFAYYPNSFESGGDMAYLDGQYENPLLGTFAYHTYMHETGHALGLKHAHDVNAGLGYPDVGTVPAHLDGGAYTVTTYNSFPGQNQMPAYYTNAYGNMSQSIMQLDIAAMQRMYGANYNTNNGDTTYTFSETTGEMSIDGVGQGAPVENVIFRTIWDGDGEDTYDFSNYTTDLNVDLSPGAVTDLDTNGTTQTAELNAGWDSTGTFVGAAAEVFADGHIYNALLHEGNAQSLIENANGGSGDDVVTGNDADNTLNGNAGSDVMNGGNGRDRLDGGDDRDFLFGENGNDTMFGGAARDKLFGGNGDDTLKGQQGRDSLKGMDGDDRLIGHGNKDFLEGGKGNDILTGSNGIDTFVYVGDRNQGDDQITDFDNGVEVIEMSARTFADLTISDVGTDKLIEWDNSSILLLNQGGTVIDQNDFMFT